jgi:hypothetical protein
MNRIYHTWDKWECYLAGFYESKHSTMDKDECEEAYRELLSNDSSFGSALNRVITDWERSCEHYLTNVKMNRIAWLGQSSICIAKGIPSVYRGGYFLLNKDQQSAADNLALKYLNRWLIANKYEETTLIGAGVKSHANIY